MCDFPPLFALLRNCNAKGQLFDLFENETGGFIFQLHLNLVCQSIKPKGTICIYMRRQGPWQTSLPLVVFCVRMSWKIARVPLPCLHHKYKATSESTQGQVKTPTEDDEHASELPWDGLWEFVPTQICRRLKRWGSMQWHAGCCQWLEYTFHYQEPSPVSFQEIWQYIQPTLQP